MTLILIVRSKRVNVNFLATSTQSRITGFFQAFTRFDRCSLSGDFATVKVFCESRCIKPDDSSAESTPFPHPSLGIKERAAQEQNSSANHEQHEEIVFFRSQIRVITVVILHINSSFCLILNCRASVAIVLE